MIRNINSVKWNFRTNLLLRINKMLLLLLIDANIASHRNINSYDLDHALQLAVFLFKRRKLLNSLSPAKILSSLDL